MIELKYKNKALELVIRFQELGFNIEQAKQCALICVDEILSASTIKLSPSGNVGKFVYIDEYWQQVKAEIEKL